LGESSLIGSITQVDGIEVGHATNLSAITGCTVILCRAGAVVGVDVRGAAPGTRETDLCRPGTLVERAQAILLTGGSAFGLDAAAGVMRYLRQHDLGFATPVGRVPIVPGAVIFDLGIGEFAWPDADMGYRACASASSASTAEGNVGAGTGATVGHALGASRATKSGVGTAAMRVGKATIGALMVVNAFGNVVARDGRILAGARDPGSGRFVAVTPELLIHGGTASGTHTTIGVVATDALLTDVQTSRLAQIAHDGLARAIDPVHTMVDGDTVFALATGTAPEFPLFPVLESAVPAVVRLAIERAVQSAHPLGGLPAAHEVTAE
jgi:L-aminopeptidase/D-esterase-like protein